MIPDGFRHAAFYDHETPHVQQSPEDVTVAHVSPLSLLIGSSDKKKKSWRSNNKKSTEAFAINLSSKLLQLQSSFWIPSSILGKPEGKQPSVNETVKRKTFLWKLKEFPADWEWTVNNCFLCWIKQMRRKTEVPDPLCDSLIQLWINNFS